MRNDTEAVKRVLKTDPWSADLTYGLAQIYFFRKDIPELGQYVARFIQIAPNSKFIVRN